MTLDKYLAQREVPRDVAGFGVFVALCFACWPLLIWWGIRSRRAARVARPAPMMDRLKRQLKTEIERRSQ